MHTIIENVRVLCPTPNQACRSNFQARLGFKDRVRVRCILPYRNGEPLHADHSGTDCSKRLPASVRLRLRFVEIARRCRLRASGRVGSPAAPRSGHPEVFFSIPPGRWRSWSSRVLVVIVLRQLHRGCANLKHRAKEPSDKAKNTPNDIANKTTGGTQNSRRVPAGHVIQSQENNDD